MEEVKPESVSYILLNNQESIHLSSKIEMVAILTPLKVGGT
jgi:hypothetical protein